MKTSEHIIPISYAKSQESIAMLKIVEQGRSDMAAGRVMPVKMVFAEIRRQFSKQASLEIPNRIQ